jgi:hypothetical protein
MKQVKWWEQMVEGDRVLVVESLDGMKSNGGKVEVK